MALDTWLNDVRWAIGADFEGFVEDCCSKTGLEPRNTICLSDGFNRHGTRLGTCTCCEDRRRETSGPDFCNEDCCVLKDSGDGGTTLPLRIFDCSIDDS